MIESTEKVLPKIYCFLNATEDGDGVAYALAEDGTVLGSHFCSGEYWVRNDLGVNEGSRLDRHKTYSKHYPDGYEMEFVAIKQFKTHAGLSKAIELNSRNLLNNSVKGDDT